MPELDYYKLSLDNWIGGLEIRKAVLPTVWMEEEEQQLILLRGIRDILDRIAQEVGWISVDDRLPEENTKVLACSKGGALYIAMYKNTDDWYGWWKAASSAHECNPRAWRPLPFPYREGNNEK